VRVLRAVSGGTPENFWFAMRNPGGISAGRQNGQAGCPRSPTLILTSGYDLPANFAL
jgi:hypothetical protein